MSTVYPEGTTPDEIDRRLEARDAGVSHAAVRRDADDAAVMAAIPAQRHLHAVVDPNSPEAIAARIAYDQKPWWQRLWLALKDERPPGLVDRYPIGPWSTSIPQDSER